ncbi:MAG: hypothetical protein E7015_01290 [Alphaproteobacteria bacterium]|nr:hypothetical protein [Alphaproteobacteria bacterium]
MQPTVLKLVCRNFRSYRTLGLGFSSRFVCFFGKNGAGKTNILEAISLFSSDRGLRKAAVADFSNNKSPKDSWSLKLSLQNGNYKTFLSTSVNNGRRVASVDDSSLTSLSKLEDFLWPIWITPSMGTIFIGSKNDRRSFFDHLVSGFDRNYKERLRRISSLQKERLHVIFFRKDLNWLQVLENKLAEENIEIAKVRRNFLEMLKKTFDNYQSDFLRPNIKISGIIEDITQQNSEENAILEIMQALSNSRIDDSEKQTTKVSVNKSQWLAYHPKTSFEAENCSTGEQKAFLISLILAVTRIYQQSKRGIPVLLLDDLMVHLDSIRRQTLTNELLDLNVQTFFTGTEIELFESINKEAQLYHVEQSICSEIY